MSTAAQRALDHKHRSELQTDERNARVQRSRDRFDAALAWASRAGFPASLQQMAASSAMALRQIRGEGQVTREAVEQRMRRCWPEAFKAADAAERSST